MSDLKELKEGFVKSGIIGKVIIGFCIYTCLFLAVFVWYTAQNSSTLTQMVRQNDNIEQFLQDSVDIEFFKKCVKEKYDEAALFYDEDLVFVMGKILMENKVTFPQELNETFTKYRKKLNALKDCLITYK